MAHDRDEWLMAQVARGRHEELEILVRRYASPLLTLIRGMVGDHQRSEDLFQDVCVAVWRHRRRYRPERPFRPWLYAIALNACRAEFRRRPPLAALVEEWAVAVDDPPGEIAVAAERATFVVAAVQQLPPRQRAVVVLRTWSGLAYAEIAEVLGRGEGTVRAQMHTALRTLRDYLEPRLRGQ